MLANVPVALSRPRQRQPQPGAPGERVEGDVSGGHARRPGRKLLAAIYPASSVTELVTDATADPDALDAVRRAGVSVHVIGVGSGYVVAVGSISVLSVG